MQPAEEKMYSQLATDLAKNFALDSPRQDLTTENFFSELEKKLSELIFDLIEKDYNRLLAILYRIDVDEKVVGECLSGKDIFTASDDLAKAVIERLIKKIKYRMQKK